MIKRVLALIVISCVTLTGCFGGNAESSEYITMVAVEDGKDLWEMRYYLDKSGTSGIYENGSLKEKRAVKGVAEQAISLYEIKDKARINIEDFKNDEPFGYNMNLEQSSVYVEQLKGEGYKVIRTVCTPTSVDIYLKNKDETIRVIAMYRSAIIGNTQESLCEIMEYFN